MKTLTPTADTTQHSHPYPSLESTSLDSNSKGPSSPPPSPSLIPNIALFKVIISESYGSSTEAIILCVPTPGTI